jgi:hypothetical protein
LEANSSGTSLSRRMTMGQLARLLVARALGASSTTTTARPHDVGDDFVDTTPLHQTQEIFNDIGGVAVAYTNVLKVLAHSWAALVAGHYIPPRTQRTWSGYVVMGPSELASPSPKATYQA